MWMAISSRPFNGKRYYFDKNGVMATGKKKIGSKVYRFNSKGVCLNKKEKT